MTPHGNPTRNLQRKGQTDPQSPKMGPGPKGDAPTVNPHCSSHHLVLMWQSPGTQADRDTGEEVFVLATFLG